MIAVKYRALYTKIKLWKYIIKIADYTFPLLLSGVSHEISPKPDCSQVMKTSTSGVYLAPDIFAQPRFVASCIQNCSRCGLSPVNMRTGGACYSGQESHA
jgi:hypothetical protein